MSWRHPTFREEARLFVHRMATKKPSISELVVSLDQDDTVALCQAQFVGAPGVEVIYTEDELASWRGVR